MTASIEAMAREAGATTVDHDDPQCWTGQTAFAHEALTRFAALVRAQALEDAARACEDRPGTMSMFASTQDWRDHNLAIKGCAAAIRALPPSE